MGKKPETICEWSQDDIAKDFGKLKKMVQNPQFVCKNCGRAAEKKKWLCKPKRLLKEA
jgi:hypothetical protein